MAQNTKLDILRRKLLLNLFYVFKMWRVWFYVANEKNTFGNCCFHLKTPNVLFNKMERYQRLIFSL